MPRVPQQMEISEVRLQFLQGRPDQVLLRIFAQMLKGHFQLNPEGSN